MEIEIHITEKCIQSIWFQILRHILSTQFCTRAQDYGQHFLAIQILVWENASELEQL